MFAPSTAAKTIPAACAGAVLFALSAPACAAPHSPDAPDWKLSGFGTVGLAHSDERQADFVASIMKGGGAGRTDSWSRHVDTRLGGQIDVSFDPKWSAVVQVVTEQRLDYSYEPRVEWANIKYQVTPELAIRVGRIALPMFIAADYRKVGYAYPWARTPLEVYGVLPISNSDGADISWHWNGETARSTTQAFYGRTDMPLFDGARLRGNNIAGLSQTVEQGDFSARASVITTRLSVGLFSGLFDALDAFGPQGRDLASRLRVENSRASALSIGLNYDPGAWFMMGEAGHSRSGGYIGSTRSAYLSGGWRHRNLTPYAGYSRVWGRVPDGPTALALGGLPPSYAAAGATVNVAVAAMLRAVPSQSTLSAGVRWDVARNVAIKLQHERVTTRDGSRGMFINSVADYRSGHTAQITSATLDFVF